MRSEEHDTEPPPAEHDTLPPGDDDEPTQKWVRESLRGVRPAARESLRESGTFLTSAGRHLQRVLERVGRGRG